MYIPQTHQLKPVQQEATKTWRGRPPIRLCVMCERPKPTSWNVSNTIRAALFSAQNHHSSTVWKSQPWSYFSSGNKRSYFLESKPPTLHSWWWIMASDWWGWLSDGCLEAFQTKWDHVSCWGCFDFGTDVKKQTIRPDTFCRHFLSLLRRDGHDKLQILAISCLEIQTNFHQLAYRFTKIYR